MLHLEHDAVVFAGGKRDRLFDVRRREAGEGRAALFEGADDAVEAR
jgi:hypothetical protein